ncbi:MAG: hypothetical protein ACK5ZG_00775 [Phycisphaerae bacterium]|jgi:hypothetical protein
MRFTPVTAPIVMIAATAMLAGCSKSRLEMVRDKADSVESSLKSEQKRVLKLGPQDTTRRARLEHLNEMQYSLRAANIGLAAIPWMPFNSEQDRDLALDVMDEVYDTIDWNIPLGPDDPKRPFPAQWSGNALKLQ